MINYIEDFKDLDWRILERLELILSYSLMSDLAAENDTE